MSVKNFIDTEEEISDIKANSVSALFAFHEYLSNSLVKMRDFVSNAVDDRNVATIPYELAESKSVLLSLTSQQYQDCLDDLDGNTTLFDSAHNSYELSNEQIVNLFQDNVAELCVQKEYVGSCLTGLTLAATDLITRVKGLYPGVPGYILEKYSRLVDDSSLSSSLQNLFSLSRFTEVITEEGVITVYTKEGYTGSNVWLVALQQIGTQVASFFENVVWKGILKIGEFFAAILVGLKNLAIWLVSRLASQFLTNYSKTSSACGLMDFPLMQCYLGRPTVNDSGQVTLEIDRTIGVNHMNWLTITRDTEDTLYVNHSLELRNYSTVPLSKARSIDYINLTASGHLSYDGNTLSGLYDIYVSDMYTWILMFIQQSLVVRNEDGTYAIRPLDVCIPLIKLLKKYYKDRGISYDVGNDFMDINIRFGLDASDQLWMQFYVVDTYENIHAFADRRNCRRMQMSMWYLPIAIGNNINCVPNLNITKYNPGYQTPATTCTGACGEYLCFYADPTQSWDQEAAYDLVSNLQCLDMMETAFNNKNIDSWSYSSTYHYGNKFTCLLFTIYATIKYCYLNSPARQLIATDWSSTDNSRKGWIKSTISHFNINYHFPNGQDIVTKLCGRSNTYLDTDNTYLTYTYTNFDLAWQAGLSNLFVPYCRSNLLPTAIHYQSIDEQASEIRNGIWAIIIAVAVIVATVKIIRFTKSQRLKQQLAQAAMDQFSWDFAKNPSTENYNKFMKARKKYKKISIMNNIFGITSSAAIEASTSSANSILESLRGVQAGDDNQPSIKTIIKLIKS